MRVSDSPICMVCYEPGVTCEVEVGDNKRLALCGDCEESLRSGDRESLFQKLDERNRSPVLGGPRVSDATYREIINGVLDSVCEALGISGPSIQ